MKEIQDMNTYQSILPKAPFCGRSIGARFGYLEAERDFDPAILVNLLTNGQHEGKILYIIRRKLARDLCSHMAASFDKIINNGTTSHSIISWPHKSLKSQAKTFSDLLYTVRCTVKNSGY